MKKVSISAIIFGILIAIQSFSQNGSVLIQPSNDEVLATKHGGSEPNLAGRFANGTATAPTATLISDNLTSFSGRGHTGSSFTNDNAKITMTANQTFTSTANGTRMTFHTTANNSTILVERMRITHDGLVGIGTTSPDTKLQVDGSAESDGTTGIFKVTNSTGSMLFDNNEIDVAGNGSLFLNYNSTGNVILANGGGRTFIGSKGSGLNEIIKITASIPNFTVLANACSSQNVSVTNAALGSAVSCTPDIGLSEGLVIAYSRVNTAGNVLIRFCNYTSASVSQITSDYHIGIIR